MDRRSVSSAGARVAARRPAAAVRQPPPFPCRPAGSIGWDEWPSFLDDSLVPTGPTGESTLSLKKLRSQSRSSRGASAPAQPPPLLRPELRTRGSTRGKGGSLRYSHLAAGFFPSASPAAPAEGDRNSWERQRRRQNRQRRLASSGFDDAVGPRVRRDDGHSAGDSQLRTIG